VGIGHRRAAFDPGKPLLLGGLKLEGAWGLKGTGDGDVVLLAAADAILGAAGLGGAAGGDGESPSAVLLAESRVKARARGLVVGNVDVTVVAPRPDLEPHARAMEERIAELLDVEPDRICVKPGTPEGLGGDSANGVFAWATALLLDAGEESAP
jgi:2-C-methyl-D-erythritol 2,4-cyclodiphosphate synthase